MSLTPPSYTPNPYLPYVSFKSAGGSSIDFGEPSDHKPQYLIDFEVTVICDNVGFWSITLFDAEYDKIETELQNNFKKGVKFKFGYQGGVQSNEMTGYIFDYIPEFTMAGLKLKINGMFGDFMMGEGMRHIHHWPTFDPTKGDYKDDKENMTIPDIIRSIIKLNEWEEGDIEDCVIHTDTNQTLDKTDPKAGIEFPQDDMTDLTFIRTKLAPYARSKDNPDVSGFYTHYDPETNKLDFISMNHKRLQKATEIITFPQDKQHEVLDFSPVFWGGMWAFLGHAKTAATCFDPNTGRVKNIDPKLVGSESTINSGDDRTDVPDRHTNRLKYEGNYGLNTSSPAPNQQQADTKAKSAWNSIYNWAFANAKLTLMGHPKWKPLTCLELKISTPPPNNKEYYLSGKWTVIGVTHKISRSGYTTELQIIRNSAAKGPTQSTGPVLDGSFAPGGET